MSVDNFQACIDIVLVYEGGLSMVRADPGNWTGGRVGRGQLRGTNFGIAASAHPTIDLPRLTREGAKTIYRADYWNKIGGDDLPSGVDLAVLDPAVNSGPGKALKWLKAARTRSTAPATIITTISDQRLSFLHALGAWRAFGAGWGARVAGIEAKALRMALGARPEAQATLANHAAAHAGLAQAARTRAAASVTGGSVAGSGVAAAHGHPGLIAVLVLLGLLGAGILAFVASRRAQRATALSREAAMPFAPATSTIKV